MAQPHNPADAQGLLQSMLQRLRLQPGRDGQGILHGPGAMAAAASHPGNGFEFGTNGIQAKEFGLSAAGAQFVFKGTETQHSSDGRELDRGPVASVPSQKDNSDKDGDEGRVQGGAASPRIAPAGTGHAFPAQSGITSLKETAQTPQLQGQGFKPKVYAWSVRPSDADADDDAGSQALHVGNGGFAASPQGRDIHFVASGLNTTTTTTNSKPRRKQRSSENTATRWTQRIKERWLDRQGSSGRKGTGQKSGQETEVSPQKQLTPSESLGEASRLQELENLTPASLDSSVDSGVDEGVRSSADFDIGLGSFSLLDEIVTGQEWAKFLNPNPPAATANQRAPEEPNPYNAGQPSLILNQRPAGNHPWSVGAAHSPPNPDFSMAATAPDASQSVSMDVSEEQQQRLSQRAADSSEPMEEWQPGVGGQHRIQSLVERADILDNPTLRKVQLNRKRQHQHALRDRSLHAAGSGPSPSSHSAMDETGESQEDVPMLPNPLCSPLPPPLSPFKPFAPVPRGVLKHSISVDSEVCMETVPKRRRVEENRRVHFSEEVQLIDPPADLYMEATDSEEDSDDSVIEHETGLEQAEMEQQQQQVAAAESRRSMFPAWIKALKRKNTGRKHS